MREIEQAIADRDFATFARLTIQVRVRALCSIHCIGVGCLVGRVLCVTALARSFHAAVGFIYAWSHALQDSNQFHAVCLDTYPPIFYMNDVSRLIVNLLTRLNSQADGVKVSLAAGLFCR
jgi:hypothetical protein